MSVNTVVAGTCEAAGRREAAGVAEGRHPRRTGGLQAVALSSTTAQRAGSAPSVAAAWRNRSGAGLPFATSAALKIRPSKRPSRPVRPSVYRRRSWVLLEATQVGVAIRSSASTTPSTGASSASSASR